LKNNTCYLISSDPKHIVKYSQLLNTELTLTLILKPTVFHKVV